MILSFPGGGRPERTDFTTLGRCPESDFSQEVVPYVEKEAGDC